MEALSVLVLLVGSGLLLWSAQREFAGSDEDEAMRVRWRRIAIVLLFAGWIVKLWHDL